MDIVGRYEDVFCNAAIAKGSGGGSNDNELFEAMKDSYVRLRNHPSGKRSIENLLCHESDWVRSWVASQLLSEDGHSRAKETLQKLASETGVASFGAMMVLSEFEKGNLGSPFGIEP